MMSRVSAGIFLLFALCFLVIYWVKENNSYLILNICFLILARIELLDNNKSPNP